RIRRSRALPGFFLASYATRLRLRDLAHVALVVGPHGELLVELQLIPAGSAIPTIAIRIGGGVVDGVDAVGDAVGGEAELRRLVSKHPTLTAHALVDRVGVGVVHDVEELTAREEYRQFRDRVRAIVIFPGADE